MYVYNGKLDYDWYAKNECFTLVFPAGFALHDPVCVHWQWSIDVDGRDKVNMSRLGLVTMVSKTIDEYNLTAIIDYYTLEITLSPNRRSVTLVMASPSKAWSSPATLALCYADNIQFPTTVTYTGKLDYPKYATNEMITLILPAGTSSKAPVGLYYQFTSDDDGVAKRNEVAVGTLSDLAKKADGTITAVFKSSYYRYQFTFSPDENTVSTIMIDPDSPAPQSIAFERVSSTKARPPVGVKKALIIRFDTGSDDGIFMVRDMLTKDLGFDAADVEMMFFDVDERGGPKSRTGSQDPPTAERFKQRFVWHLLSGARSGDVRFLYVDAHGTVWPDEESGEVDNVDEGWTLAKDDDGRQKEVVYDDWLSKAIRENIKPGVNLAILTSSCMGGGMLDTNTPGLLLAGCHESQFNVKALRVPTNDPDRTQVVDPWMYAITKMINRRVKRRRGVPTYSELFNEAKRYIGSILNDSRFDRKNYLGPSPDETKPVPRDMDSMTSHQDPQLIFYDGFVNPDAERFLFPIAAPTGGDASKDATTRRYPRDEHVHDEL
ncbi:hypothetical protein V8D89_003942 [Ganoderma adspersum]